MSSALPSELSSRLVEPTGIEPAPPGLPGALHELRPLAFVWRNADTQSAPCPPGSGEPGHRAERKRPRESMQREAKKRPRPMLVRFIRRCVSLSTRWLGEVQNANDHEREGARTSGVTNLIVAVPAMEPCSCDIAFSPT